MTFPNDNSFPQCTSSSDLAGHYFKNIAREGERVLWKCIHCGRETSNPAALSSMAKGEFDG